MNMPGFYANICARTYQTCLDQCDDNPYCACNCYNRYCACSGRCAPRTCIPSRY